MSTVYRVGSDGVAYLRERITEGEYNRYPLAQTLQCFECCREVPQPADGQTVDGRTKVQTVYYEGLFWLAHNDCSKFRP